jgi:hypothetical protein
LHLHASPRQHPPPQLQLLSHSASASTNAIFSTIFLPSFIMHTVRLLGIQIASPKRVRFCLKSRIKLVFWKKPMN